MKTNKLAKQIGANKLHFSETLNPKQEINGQQIQEGSKVQKLSEWKKYMLVFSGYLGF
jgi:hypothetical protein